MTVCIVDDYIYWLWLSLTGGVANKNYALLLEYFKDAKEIYKAGLDDYAKIDGLERKFAKKLCDKDLSQAKEVYDFCKQHSVRLLHCQEPDYPVKLKWIYAYPVLLYVYGTLPNLNEVLTVGVVGTRSYTDYGKIAAYRIGGGLARAKSVVISGMAFGNDSIAQLAAINNGGKTIAVMGTGIDRIYPNEHRELAKLIAKNGALVTEFAPGTPPAGKNFPIRNRIISGLSDAVALIECKGRSGALITTKFATEQSRGVYAVPGDITSPTSEGPISLIKDGAKPITTAADIVEDFVCQYSYLNAVMENTNFDVAVPRGVNTAFESSLISPKQKTKRHSQAKVGEDKGFSAGKLLSGIKKVKNSAQKKTSSKNKTSETEIEKENTEIKPASEKKQIPDNLTEVESYVFNRVCEAKNINAEALACEKFPTSDIMSALTKLEILDLIKALPGDSYIPAE